jgi:hypothetical protein
MHNSLATLLMALYFFSFSLVQRPASQLEAHDFKIGAVTMDEALKQVARTYKTAIGLEQSGQTATNQRVTVALSNATVTEALDAVIKSARGKYSWRQEPGGAIHVFIPNADFSLPDVVLSEFDAQGVNRAEISGLLNQSTEVVAWRKEHNCSLGGGIVITGAAPVDSAKVNLNTTGQTLRSNLDQIVSELGTYFWIVDQEPARKGCFATITIPPPDPPRR